MRILVLIAACMAPLLLGSAAARAEASAKAEPSPPLPVSKGLPWEKPSAKRADPAPEKPEDPALESAQDDDAGEAEKDAAAAQSDTAEPSDPATTEETPEETVTAEPAEPVPAGPVVTLIREKLSDASVTRGVNEADVEGLKAFYKGWGEPPLWVTDEGLAARAKTLMAEIGKAETWGLDADDFELPDADAVPDDEEAQALTEIKLDLAILKYARFARGGRQTPSEVDRMFDQSPPLMEPKAVMAGIAAADTPDEYLQSLHPSHDQFSGLRQALVKELEAEKPNKTTMRRLIMNMERWRWMPEDLGQLHVWLNTPEFMLYLVKDGKAVFSDKTLVGAQKYATPIFSAEMDRIVFNPSWVAPPSVLRDKLWPALKRKQYSVLDSNHLTVRYKGRRVDPKKVDWKRANIYKYTFSQPAGPKNVLGKAKFLYPNKHIVYMHDTLPYRQKNFKQKTRAVGNACVRMERPREFAALLLAEDQDFASSKVKSLWDKGANNAVSVENGCPVHTTYFTATVDEDGKVSTFADIYGLDTKHAKALFGSSEGFPKPPPVKEYKPRGVASTSSSSGSTGAGFASSFGGD